MSETVKNLRLAAVAKDFNLGLESVVEHLHKKGFADVESKPMYKLTEEMYSVLLKDFRSEMAMKEKKDLITLGAKKRDSLELDEAGTVIHHAPISQEIKLDPPPHKLVNKETNPVKPATPPQPESPAEPIKITIPKVGDKEEISMPALTGKVSEKPVKGKIIPADSEPVTPLPAVQVSPKTPTSKKKTASKSKDLTGDLFAQPQEKDKPIEIHDKDNPAEIIAVKPIEKTERRVVVEGPKIVGKLDLTKPVNPSLDAPPPVTGVANPTPDTEAPVSGDKREFIEMEKVKLEGPRIVGKVDLSSLSDSDEAAKKKRKRIKKSANKVGSSKDGAISGGPGNSGGPDNRSKTLGSLNPGNRPAGQQNRPTKPGTQNRNPNAGNNNSRGPQSGDRGSQPNRPGELQGGPRRNEPLKDGQKEFISEKEIQDKIKATMAKLQGSSGKRGSPAKGKIKKTRYDISGSDQQDDGAKKPLSVSEFISVSELASLMDVSPAQVISVCMSLGSMVSINQRLDAEIIVLVADEFGYDAQFIDVRSESEYQEGEDNAEDSTNLISRPPIVTIMGHVDHGKTSLLDHIRSTNVIAGEMGGITQHIGAYEVTLENKRKITFLDTPGHEAFTAMRARGAKVTDIAVIVIAADDAVMPQTKEAISHAQAAQVPMIFAINKMDKPGANPERIREQLSQMNILVEDWGGKYQCQEIVAKNGKNIDLLLEKIILEAEMLELKANPNKPASGTVIEASLDKGRGYVTTMMVLSGTLKVGDYIVTGPHAGKVKAMFNERSQKLVAAGPATPVSILGLNDAPQAGENFKVYIDEAEAKEIANRREQIIREQGIRTKKHITLDEIGRRLALGNFQELKIIVKGDVDGSVEALKDSLLKLSTEEIMINVIHSSVGQITESDVLLASASDAVIIGFQVRPSGNARKIAERESIDIRLYSVIYDAIEELKSAMEGMLKPTMEEKIVCNIEVREVFKISKVGTIAGCYVLDGICKRDTKIRVIRDGIVIHTGELDSLKRFKDDVKEVKKQMECGLNIKNFNDIREGDIIEGFEQVEVKRTLN